MHGPPDVENTGLTEKEVEQLREVLPFIVSGVRWIKTSMIFTAAVGGFLAILTVLKGWIAGK